jgi:hypothetical protein
MRGFFAPLRMTTSKKTLALEWVVAVEKEGEGGGGVGLAHESLADEEGVVAEDAEAGDVVGGANAAFGDGDGMFGDEGSEFGEDVGVDGEGAEIAAVDTEEIEAEADGALELGAVVGLAEDVEIHAVGLVAEIAERLVSVGGDDEEDGVGSGGTGLEDLEGVEDEVLAEAGNFDGGGGLFEVG